MEDGLYRVRFSTPMGSGCGVVTAHQGRLTGGDSRSFYVGEYTLEYGYLTVELEIQRHNPRVILPSILGSKRATAQLDGYFDGQTANLTGFAVSALPVKLKAVIERLHYEPFVRSSVRTALNEAAKPDEDLGGV